MTDTDHKHTDECWEPDSGCDLGKNPKFVAVGNPMTDTDALVAMLRTYVECGGRIYDETASAAADLIEQQAAEIERLRGRSDTQDIEIARLNRLLDDPGTTHADGCWSWGPKHYGCAEAEIERLTQLCACAYQMAGVAGAPVRFLDALSRHDEVTDEQIDALLPVTRDEFDNPERDEARAALDDVSTAIGSNEFMDPPDGGSVTLAEQVRRMRAALAEAQKDAERFAWCLANFSLRDWYAVTDARCSSSADSIRAAIDALLANSRDADQQTAARRALDEIAQADQGAHHAKKD